MGIYQTVLTNNTVSTTSNLLWTGNDTTYYFDPTLTFHYEEVGPAYKSPAIQQQIVEGAARKPKADDPLAWLKRRVDEVCWVPA